MAAATGAIFVSAGPALASDTTTQPAAADQTVVAPIVSPDTAATDTSATDREKADKEKADKEKADKEKADKDCDTKKADTDKADTDKADTDKADTDKADTDKADTDKADTDKADTDKAEKHCDTDKDHPQLPVVQSTPVGHQGSTMTATAVSGPIPTSVSAGEHTTPGWEVPVGVAFVVIGTAGVSVSIYRRNAFGR